MKLLFSPFHIMISLRNIFFLNCQGIKVNVGKREKTNEIYEILSYLTLNPHLIPTNSIQF